MADADRIHGFDALRAIALLLGLVIHAMMPYLRPPIQLWPVLDSAGHFGYTVLIVTLHSFRLQTFFLLAGFFSALLVAKRGVRSFVMNRFWRIVVPFVLSLLLLVPLMQVGMILGYATRAEAGYVHIGKLILDTRAYQTTITDFFREGLFLTEIMLFHLWFLYYLIKVYCVYLVGRFCLSQLKLLAGLEILGKRLLASRFLLVWLSLMSAITMWPMLLWQTDTPYTLIPNPSIITYYLFFFLIGVAIQKNPDFVQKTSEQCGRYFLLALLIYPVAIFLQSKGPQMNGVQGTASLEWPALICYSVFTWSMVLGLLGGSIKWFSRRNSSIRRISETAYWQYLLHLPLLFFLQFWMMDLHLGSLVEIALQVTLVTLILYYSYVWWVGRTAIGKLLCGRRISDLT